MAFIEHFLNVIMFIIVLPYILITPQVQKLINEQSQNCSKTEQVEAKLENSPRVFQNHLSKTEQMMLLNNTNIPKLFQKSKQK